MALNEKELQELKQLRRKAGSRRRNQQPSSVSQNTQPQSTNEPSGNFFTETFGDIKETYSNIGNSIRNTGRNIAEDYQKTRSGERNAVSGGFDMAGELLSGIGNVGGELIQGGLRSASPQSAEDAVGEQVERIGQAVAENRYAQNALETYDALPENTKQDLKTAGNYGQALLDVLTLGAGKAGSEAVSSGVNRGVSSARNTVGAARNRVSSSIGSKTEGVQEFAKGAGDTARGAGRTVTRGFKNIGNRTRERGQTARERATLPEPEQRALNNQVSESIINRIKKAPANERSFYRQAVNNATRADLDDANGIDISVPLPEEMTGQQFIKQFQTLENQRKQIGQQIGERANQLSRNKEIDISPDLAQLERNARNLDSLTRKQRNTVQNLLDEARADGSELSARQIYAKNRLFSQLEREAKADNVADLTYTKQDGSTGNFFDDAREVFNERLSKIDPQIRKLNEQYAPLARIRRDVEDKILSIDKNRIMDDAALEEFAPEAGRRLYTIDSNNVSAPGIGRLADRIDGIARQYGYDEISPQQAAEFSRELEDYFEVTKKNSFRGQIESAINSQIPQTQQGFVQALIDGVVEAGSATRQQQQQSIREVLDYVESQQNR